MTDTCTTACIMELQAAGFCGEAQEARAEVARLRAALERIEKPGYGLEFNDTLREREEHWRNCAMSYRAIAREALAHPR